MASPGVDTFEHDIANEIRQKEASIADIASAVGDIGNTTKTPEVKNSEHSSSMIGIVVILSICGLLGAMYAGYVYMTSHSDSSTLTDAPVTDSVNVSKKKDGVASLKSISPTIDEAVGYYIESVKKNNQGYSMTLSSYSPVFAYMIKNDALFGEELATAVGNTHTIKSKITISASTTKPVATVSTTTAGTSTSTQTISTSTVIEKLPEDDLPSAYIFTDVTISNQDMRVATSKFGTVVYAFVGTQTLLIGNSTDAILSMKSSLLHK